MSKNSKKNSTAKLEESDKRAYNPKILKSFEYFLSQEKTQDNLLQNLINDYRSRTSIVKKDGNAIEVIKPGALSARTIFSLAASFLKSPFNTWNLLKFYQNQKKYNTPEFQTALLSSDKTWDFVDRTANNLEKVSSLMTNMGVDLFQEGKPLDRKGMSLIKRTLKSPEFIATIREIAIASKQQNPNYLELSSKLLGAIEKDQNASAFFAEKGKSIQEYIALSVEAQIKQEEGIRNDWDRLSQNSNKQQEREEKIKFLKRLGITGRPYEEALQNGKLPKSLKENIAEYGLQANDINSVLKIVPILLDSPGELKKVINSINQGKYSDVAKQIISLAEDKPEIKEYLNENQEIFRKVVGTMLQDNKYFANSGLKEQIYNLVPVLLDNPKALNEIIDIYDKSDYLGMTQKIFELMEKNTRLKEYFIENSAEFEKLTSTIIQDTIAYSRENLKEENINWQKLDPEAKRAYLDNDPNWKDYSKSAKDRMITRGTLQDLGETLSFYGIDEKDIGAISHIAMLTLNNPKNANAALADIAKGDFTNLAQNIFTLFEEVPAVNSYLIKEKALIGKILQANLANVPGLKDINFTDLAPFLLNNPKAFKEIVQMAKQERYGDIAPKIFELAKEDRTLANYLKEHQSALTKSALASTGFDKYGLSEDISDIFVQLTTEDNLTKLQGLAELAKKGQWVKVGSELADLIDKDPKFRLSLDKNRDNINKIVEIVLLKNPSLRSSISALETGALANNILSDPGGVRDLLNAYESGNKVALGAQVTKFTTKKIFNSEFRGAVYNSAVNWIYGKGEAQQQLASAIAEALDKQNPTSQRLDLSDFVKSAFLELADNSASLKDKNTFLKQINNKTFFEGVTIEGFGKEPLKFHNLDINDTQFVNTNFKNVSFEGTKISNTSFHGASFENVRFNGATIDNTTFENMLPAIRKGSISLNGVKIIGSLDNLDLKDISFKGADLSEVTSMNGTNITGANFITAKLPENKNILIDSFGLKSAAFGPDTISQEQYKLNQDKICESITSQLVKKSKSTSVELSVEEVTALKQTIIKLYNEESEVGDRFRTSINTHSHQLLNQTFPIDPSSISHVLEYKGQASHQLTLIYDHIKDPEKIQASLVSDIIADQITTNLFGKGSNRGQDGLEIQKTLATAISDIVSEYGIPAQEILSYPKIDLVIEEMTKDVRSKTKNTTAGMLTGGLSGRIYLPEGAIKSDDFKGHFEKLAVKINMTHGRQALTSSEKELVSDISTTIATNIFGPSVGETNPDNIELIAKLLEKTLYELKTENADINLEATILANKDKLIGRLDHGWVSTSGEGLTKLFYDNKTYIGSAFASNVHTDNFKDSLKEKVAESIAGNIAQSAKTPHIEDGTSKKVPPIAKNKAMEIGEELTKDLSKGNNRDHVVRQNQKKISVIDR